MVENQRLTQFYEYLKYFELFDLLGLAKLLKVEEDDDFDELLCKLGAAFDSTDKLDQKIILSMMKDIVKDNKTSCSGNQEFKESPKISKLKKSIFNLFKKKNPEYKETIPENPNSKISQLLKSKR